MHRASKLRNYAIQAVDGEIGRVTDLLFDDQFWIVRWLVVDTGGWLSRDEVLLPSSHLDQINAHNQTIGVDLTQAEVKDTPAAESRCPISRQFEASVYEYYGWAPYWTGLSSLETALLVPER